MLVLIVTNLLLLGFSQLKSCIRTVACQGIALGVLSLLVNEDGFTVWSVVMSGVVIGLKGVIFPGYPGALRNRCAPRVEPYIGHMAYAGVCGPGGLGGCVHGRPPSRDA